MFQTPSPCLKAIRSRELKSRDVLLSFPSLLHVLAGRMSQVLDRQRARQKVELNAEICIHVSEWFVDAILVAVIDGGRMHKTTSTVAK